MKLTIVGVCAGAFLIAGAAGSIAQSDGRTYEETVEWLVDTIENTEIPFTNSFDRTYSYHSLSVVGCNVTWHRHIEQSKKNRIWDVYYEFDIRNVSKIEMDNRIQFYTRSWRGIKIKEYKNGAMVSETQDDVERISLNGASPGERRRIREAFERLRVLAKQGDC